VGVAFGVVLVREKSVGGFLQVEVATFRSDGTYSDGRHPDAVRFTTPQEDAQRRDFTCNGLFLDPLANGGAGALHDFVGGQMDIQKKILRAIGDPAARFAEDHLRLMRAVRFAARLGFSMDAETLTALKRLAPNIRTISKERIHDELSLILTHPSRAAAADWLQSSGLFENLWPAELYARPEEVPRYFASMSELPPDFVVVLADLYKNLAYVPDSNPGIVPPALRLKGSNVAALLRRDLLLNNVETADFAWLLDNANLLLGWEAFGKAIFKRLLADPRWPRLAAFFTHISLDAPRRALFSVRVAALQAEGVAPAPFITGDTLIKMGATPNPQFRQWIDALYDRQLEGEFADKEQALAAARKLIEP
jgi:poly(A) polymerase